MKMVNASNQYITLVYWVKIKVTEKMEMLVFSKIIN